MAKTKKTIKVAFLSQLNTNEKDIGGADIHIQNLLKALSAIEDLDLHYITLNKSVNKNTMKLNNGITYHILKSPKLPKTITGILVDYKALINKVQEIKPDIVHAQVLGAPYGLATMKLNKYYPTVLTAHTIVEMDTMNSTGTIKGQIHDYIWKNLEKKEIKRINNFIVVSKSMEEEMKKRGAQNIRVIPNGISSNWFNLPSSEVDGRVLFVGRITTIKALEILLQALNIIKLQKPNTTIHIVGPVQDKHYKNKLDTMIRTLRLQSSVIFTGPKTEKELVKEYSECSVFVLPSKNESFGIVLLEAMASGKPIIASNVGGIPEIIHNGQEGFLVKSGNPEQLADRMVQLLSNRELRQKMGMSGKERARNYSWEIVAEKTVNYYKEIIGESK